MDTPNYHALHRQPLRVLGDITKQRGVPKMFVELFSTPSGLASLAVIVFMLGMAVWFGAYFSRKMKEDEDKAAERGE